MVLDLALENISLIIGFVIFLESERPKKGRDIWVYIAFMFMAYYHCFRWRFHISVVFSSCRVFLSPVDFLSILLGFWLIYLD